MTYDSYIVEGTNWKCKVNLEKNSINKGDFKLVEAATRCIEHLFSYFPQNECVDVFELRNSKGVDYFKQKNLEEVPDPSFGLLTKIYKVKDAKNKNNHYVIRTRTLLENAGVFEGVKLIMVLEKETKKNLPELYNSIETVLKNKIIFKMGDLDKGY